MGSTAVEKTEQELRQEINELLPQQRQISERPRSPPSPGFEREGLSDAGPRNFTANVARQSGLVRPITERLRSPPGFERGGFSAAGPCNFAANVARQGDPVRPLQADGNEAEDQPPAKRRLLSGVVKVEDGETIENDADKEQLAEKGNIKVGNVEPRFISLEAQNLYYKVLKSEVLIPSMRFDWVELDHSEFNGLFNEITSLGLREFLGFKDDIYEDLVREFYANLVVTRSNVDSGVHLKSSIQGKDIFICEENLCIWFKLPKGGVRPRASLLDSNILRHEDGDTDEEVEDNYGYDEEKGDELLGRICIDHSTPYEAMDLPLNYRLLHYAINRVIYPKKASNNHITSLDKEIIWHLEEGRKINFSNLIIQMMRKKANLLRGELRGKTIRHKGMPYGALITYISKLQRCNLSSYEHYPYPTSWRFTPYNIRSMKLVKTTEKGWVYAYHVEKLGLTLESEQQVPKRQRSKRASERPSSARPSNVKRSEVSLEDLQEIRDQIAEVNVRLDLQQGILIRLEKSIKKIFDKFSCKHDNASPS